MPIENIRLSETARDQLITLKRRTGIKNWNVLCRWGFCASLAEPTIPPNASLPADSSVEMTWRVFTGGLEDVYWSLLVERCKRDGLPLEDPILNQQFRLHLHRGISYLYGDRSMRTIADLVGRAVR